MGYKNAGLPSLRNRWITVIHPFIFSYVVLFLSTTCYFFVVTYDIAFAFVLRCFIFFELKFDVYPPVSVCTSLRCGLPSSYLIRFCLFGTKWEALVI